jgi:hypothetical protein
MIDLPDFDAVFIMEAFESFINGFILVHIQTDDVLLYNAQSTAMADD